MNEPAVLGEETAKRPGRELLELMGVTLSIAIVLLPATGYATRLGAYLTVFGTESTWPYIVAWSAPLPELALLGLYNLVLPLIVFLNFTTLSYMNRQLTVVDRRNRLIDVMHYFARQPAPLRALFLAGPVIVVVAIILLTPDFVAILIGLLIGAGSLIIIRPALRERRGVRLSEIWWVLALLLFVGGFLVGVLGVVRPSPADFRFKPDAQTVVADGRYDLLGEANGFSYLLQCNSRRAAVVKDEEILGFRPAKEASQSGLEPSLFEILARHRALTIGYQAC